MSQRRAVIAVVDDDLSFREAIAGLLLAFDFEVAPFASGPAYLSRGRDLAPDCLVLDVSMPAMSGLELQARLRRRGETAPIVFLSAVADGAARERAFAGGAVQWLAKPCDPQALVDSIRLALRLARPTHGR